jgi:hypothetical protein
MERDQENQTTAPGPRDEDQIADKPARLRFAERDISRCDGEILALYEI